MGQLIANAVDLKPPMKNPSNRLLKNGFFVILNEVKDL
jgi:hypothetical protein